MFTKPSGYLRIYGNTRSAVLYEGLHLFIRNALLSTQSDLIEELHKGGCLVC